MAKFINEDEYNKIKLILKEYNKLLNVQEKIQNLIDKGKYDSKLLDKEVTLRTKLVSLTGAEHSNIKETMENLKAQVTSYEELQKLSEKTSKEKEKILEKEKEIRKEAQMVETSTDKLKEAEEKLNKLIKENAKYAVEHSKAKQNQEERQKKVNKAYEEYLNLQKQEAKDKYNENIKSSIKSTLTSTFFGDSLNAIGGEEALKQGGSLVLLAAKTFSKAVDIFKEYVKRGFEENYNTTEANYNKIVASNRLGTGLSGYSGGFSFNNRSYKGYFGINNAINDALWSDGLYNNIKNTDVIESLGTLTSSGGMDFEKALSKAYSDNVIKYILPYLDTSSETWNNIEMLMPSISKNIAGTNIAIREEVGSSQFISKHTEDLIKLLEPVSLQANKELYAEQYSLIASEFEKLVADKTLTPDEAASMMNEAFQMYLDPTGTMRDGSIVAKWTTSNAITSGNIDNPAYYAQEFVNLTNQMLNWGGNDTILRNEISRSALGNSTRHRYFNSSDSIASGDALSSDESIKKFEKLIGLSDELNTTEDKYLKLAVNATADVSEIKTLLGKGLFEFGEFLISGIGALIVTHIVSGIIGKNSSKVADAIGNSASSNNTASILGLMFALGTTATLIARKINAEGAEKDNQAIINAQEMREAQITADGFSSTAGNLMSISNNLSDATFRSIDDKYGGTYTFGTISKTLFGKTKSATNDKLKHTTGDAYRDKDPLTYNKAELGLIVNADGMGETMFSNIMYAYLLGLSAQGYDGNKSPVLQAIQETSNVKGDPDINMMKALLLEMGYSRSQYDFGVDYINKLGASLWTRDGKWFKPKKKDYDTIIDNLSNLGVEAETLDNLKSHRQGLNEVPYDDYPALLHQGEAVLTATTANELRNLLDEYRKTSNQAVNFDVIIQNQTTALVYKMDEIIRAIGSTSITTSSATNLMQKSKDVLSGSLLRVSSTKGFGK